ncbi:hypothetical protein, partial [Escherichia coli]|uniref:hypothetical protein n=1 Tax=Escherichia coli TaxID=562 RepID=UPI001BC925B9
GERRSGMGEGGVEGVNEKEMKGAGDTAREVPGALRCMETASYEEPVNISHIGKRGALGKITKLVSECDVGVFFFFERGIRDRCYFMN